MHMPLAHAHSLTHKNTKIHVYMSCIIASSFKKPTQRHIYIYKATQTDTYHNSC